MSKKSHSPQTRLNEPIGIIAGGGRLPVSVAEAVIDSGRDVFICALEGYGDQDLENYPHEWVCLASVDRILARFKQANCRKIVMIGHVKRPDMSAVSQEVTALPDAVAQIITAHGGDNQILSGIAEFLETMGFSVLGVHEVIPENLVGKGAIGKHIQKPDDNADIAAGFKVLKVMGDLDVGQAVVVCAGYVLAVEAAEGTDEMLRRVAKLRKDGVVHHKGGVMVKGPKSNQDMRVDMPVIGPVSVELVAEAGLSGIVVHANCVLCHDRAALIRRADELGVFVEGTLPLVN